MSINYSFAAKKILITGGGQGIGKTMVERFHKSGAKVFTVDRNAEAVQMIRKELPGVKAEVIDITDWAAAEKAIKSFGTIDHLVNSAAVVVKQKFLNITKEAASKQFDVNVSGLINVSQVVSRMLIADGKEGSIVNIGSWTGKMANPFGTVVYAALKLSLENHTKSMALELGPYKIRVNCILPGRVDTPLYHSIQATPGRENFMSARLINSRVINPTEITDLAMFLLSPLSKMIVGQSVAMDGGMTAT